MNLFELLNAFSIAAPQPTLIASIDDGNTGDDGGGGGDGDAGESDEGEGTDGDGEHGTDNTRADDGPSRDTAPKTPVVQMTKEEFDRQIGEAQRKARNQAAAEMRKKQRGKQKKSNTSNNHQQAAEQPPAFDPTQLAETIQETVKSTVSEMFEGLRSDLTAKEQRAEYDALMTGHGINPELSDMLYDRFKSEKPKDPDVWVAKKLESIGAQVPKQLRKTATLKSVGPAGVRDLSQVADLNDLTADERAQLGPRKLREMWDRKHKKGRAGNPFVRQKD